MRQFKPGQLQPKLLYDITASYALNANIETNKITFGNITASVQSSPDIFLIKSASLNLFQVQNTGVVILATQSAELSNPAPIGGIYFTSSSFFVGLD